MNINFFLYSEMAGSDKSKSSKDSSKSRSSSKSSNKEKDVEVVTSASAGSSKTTATTSTPKTPTTTSPSSAGGAGNNQGAGGLPSGIDPYQYGYGFYNPFYQETPFHMGQYIPYDPNFDYSMGGYYPVPGGHEVSDEESDDDDDIETLPGSASEMGEGKKSSSKPEKDLFKGLKKGKLAASLQAYQQDKAEASKGGDKLGETLAQVISSYFEEPYVPADMESAVKMFPRPENVEKLVAPKLESQLFNSSELNAHPHVRMFDIALQSIQKGLVAAITAMAPLGEAMLKKGEEDNELDALGENFGNATRFLVNATNGISLRRKELLKPYIAPMYAKALNRDYPEGKPECMGLRRGLGGKDETGRRG